MKIPEPLKNELLEREEIEPFEPMGRKMREWILINRKKSEDYLKDKEIFEKSLEYVASIANVELKKK